MKIGFRSIKELLKGMLYFNNYKAIFNSIFVYENSFNNFKRYILGSGEYPYKIRINTPLGKISPQAYFYDDLLTINEIFCREDYPVPKKTRIILDVGSNIGLSALYFLTRDKDIKCYLYEPVITNIKKLKINLKNFGGRYILKKCAVFNKGGNFYFKMDETGRYGGLHRLYKKKIKVKTLNINGVINDVLKKEGYIDILKLDIEGDELTTVKAINKNYLDMIGRIYFEIDISAKEDEIKSNLFPDRFIQQKHGNIIYLISRAKNENSNNS